MEAQITSSRRFAIIDEWILDLPVSDRAIRLYAVLARYADKDTHKAFPSRGLLAERLRCSSKSVDRAINELIDAQLLVKEQRFNSSLVFTLTVGTPVSRGVDSGDQGGWTPESRGVDTGDDLTITTELEPKELEPIKESTRENRATRLPQDWYPSERLLEMFATKWPNLDQQFEIEDFILYWHSVPTTKTDWDRTFQRWMNTNQQKAVKQRLVRGERLTNNKKAALLAQKYRAEAQAQRELEAVENPQQVKELESEVSTWLKGVDDV